MYVFKELNSLSEFDSISTLLYASQLMDPSVIPIP